MSTVTIVSKGVFRRSSNGGLFGNEHSRRQHLDSASSGRAVGVSASSVSSSPCLHVPFDKYSIDPSVKGLAEEQCPWMRQVLWQLWQS